MPAATRFRSFSAFLFGLLAAAGLLSGCQSSRASFAFQPIVLRAPSRPAAVAAPVIPATASQAASAIPATVAKAANRNPSVAASPVLSELMTNDAPAGGLGLVGAKRPATAAATLAEAAQETTAAQALLPQAAPSAATAWSVAAAAPASQATPKTRLAARWPVRQLLHRAHAPAAQGLGLTVLGLLAMVALVVALIGLAISGGGLGWIITAGVAALVLLLAYLDPGGH